MTERFLLIAVLLPLLGALPIASISRRGQRAMYTYVGVLTVLTCALTWALILTCGEGSFRLLQLTDKLSFTLRLDGLGRFFAGIIATLWPLTLLYAREYMLHEQHLGVFYTFFTMACGVALGIAMSGNLFTMYAFYELLTLTTVPLVMATLTKEAVHAARIYFAFSLSGAAFAFISMMYLTGIARSGAFVMGGIVPPESESGLLLAFYVLGFFGFGVKAAVFPAHIWLPKASVAPTPVTALLHGVAVVKSGVFAVIRLTFYSYGTHALAGTWAQHVVLLFAGFTVVFGAAKAVREQHWKRRLAYSTVANLSYILLGVGLMTQAGLAGAMLHMAFHAQIKLLAFFCAGAVLHGTGRQYLPELDGLGRKMPITFGCFTVAALALTGIPPLSGFVSKWYLLTAAAQTQDPWGYAAAAALLTAALLTAVYMLGVVCRAWFCKGKNLDDVHEVAWPMTVPMTILAVSIVLVGLAAGPITNAVFRILETA